MKTDQVIISVLILLSIAVKKGIAQPFPVIITTTIPPPVNAYINQALSNTAKSASVTFRNTAQAPVTFRIWGKIERVVPSQLKIEINPLTSFNILPPIDLQGGQAKSFDNNIIKQAFANFSESDLQFTPGSAVEQIKSGLNYKLPEGQYTLCIYAGTIDASQRIHYFADPNSIAGCAMFTICKLSAPQFIQPVNNLNISSTIPIVRPASPFVFTWLPPQASCSVPMNALTYNFEIREILDDQTITDAINNPFIFRKAFLRATTFLLDTNLYKNILRPGRKYAIRVQADSSGSLTPLTFENNGVSRIEAFQYGNDINGIVSVTGLNNSESYFIPFADRKTGLWDSIYTGYQNRTRRDTLIPVKEYIGLELTENGIGYNLDAIELFLALNPALIGAKSVKLSQTPVLPVFGKVSPEDRKKFDTEFQANLLPDTKEEAIFKSYLDSFHASSTKLNLPASAAKITNDLRLHLDKFNQEVHNVNRISLNLINKLMPALLSLVHSSRLVNNDQTKLQSIVSDILQLTTESPGDALSLIPLSPDLKTLLCYYKPDRLMINEKPIGFVNYPASFSEAPLRNYYVNPKKQLLPFDVVVWRYSKESPSIPVSDAPDLTGVFRILYTTPALYNERNPEINAISSSRLASTAPVSLPASSGYYIWAQNMLTHQLIKPQKVEINGAFLLANKRNWPDSKNYKIILKVN
jgi:hypothetical protein